MTGHRATTPDLAEKRARRTYLVARAASGCAALSAALILGSLCLTVGLAVVPAALVAACLVLMSPAGGVASAFTVWAGRWVSSCPYCHEFKLRRVEVRVRECDRCGVYEGEVTGVAGGGWVVRYSGGEPAEEYCSVECSRSREGGI